MYKCLYTGCQCRVVELETFDKSGGCVIRLCLEHSGNQVVDWRLLINLVVVIRLCLEHFGNQVVDLRLLLIWWL